MTEQTKQQGTRVTTPKAILSYPHLFKPVKAEGDTEEKYSVSLVFPAGSDLAAMKAAAIAAGIEKFGDKFEPLLREGKLRMPFRTDVADKGYPEGATFVNARNKQKPGVVHAYNGADNKPALLTDESLIYPGCFARAVLVAFGYDTKGNKGVSFSLQNIQHLGDGPRLDSRKNARDDFDAVEEAPAPMEGSVPAASAPSAVAAQSLQSLL